MRNAGKSRGTHDDLLGLLILISKVYCDSLGNMLLRHELFKTFYIFIMAGYVLHSMLN